MKKIILAVASVIILTLIFTLINSGAEIAQINQLFAPLLFAITFVICFISHAWRRMFLAIAAGLLGVMIFTDLFNMLEVANLLGSLGFGMFLLISLSYIPQLYKRGYIEKL